MFPFCDFNNLIKTLFLFSDPKYKKKGKGKEKFVHSCCLDCCSERKNYGGNMDKMSQNQEQIHKRYFVYFIENL